MTDNNQPANTSASSNQPHDNQHAVGAGGAAAYSTQSPNQSDIQPSVPSMPQVAQMDGRQYQQVVQAYSSQPTNFQSPGPINTYKPSEQVNYTHNTGQVYTNQSSNNINNQFTGNSNPNHLADQSHTQTTTQVSSALPANQVYIPQNPSQLDAHIISPVNSSHQKSKFSKLILLLLIGLMSVLCIICIGVAGFAYFLTQQVKGLKTLQTERYTFFYPDNYVSSETLEGEILFINPEKNQMGGNNSIRTLDDISLEDSDKVKNEKTCREFYESLNESLNNNDFDDIRLNIDSVGYYEFAKTRECSADLSFSTNSLGIDGKVFIKARLIVKDGARGGVVASYDDKVSEEEKDQLSRSIQLFNLR